MAALPFETVEIEQLVFRFNAVMGLCWTNRLTSGLPVLPDRLIPRPL